MLSIQAAIIGLQLWPIPAGLRPLSCTVYTVRGKWEGRFGGASAGSLA